MNDHHGAQRSHMSAAFAAQLELMSGGVSGASTYRVLGLAQACVLKVVEANSAVAVRERGYREIRFYDTLAIHLPLRTPQVLASQIDESGACALLLAAYEPLQPAQTLRVDDFTEIAHQLARFHAVYWNQTDLLTNLSWLATPITPNLAYDARHARETWLALAQQPQFYDILTKSTLHDIEAALEDVQTTPEYNSNTAMTLCHGDCHLDNLLRDQEGHLIWADWQEVRIGYGPNDLTFLIQRAEANGAKIAHDSIIAAYCKTLAVAGIKGVDKNVITSAMNRSERRTRLLYWPDYMGDATTEAMTHHLTRIFCI